ncbi:uncharacterized protein CCOS01_03096, partial [Colletotrichum costaricense]
LLVLGPVFGSGFSHRVFTSVPHPFPFFFSFFFFGVFATDTRDHRSVSVRGPFVPGRGRNPPSTTHGPTPCQGTKKRPLLRTNQGKASVPVVIYKVFKEKQYSKGETLCA